LQGGPECRRPFDKGFIELKTRSILFCKIFRIWYLFGTYQVSREKYWGRHFWKNIMPTTTLKKLKLSTVLHMTNSVAIYKEKILIIGCIPFSLLYFNLWSASIFTLIHTSVCHLPKINDSQLSIYPTTLVALTLIILLLEMFYF
jgi:hypothetical protein